MGQHKHNPTAIAAAKSERPAEEARAAADQAAGGADFESRDPE